MSSYNTDLDKNAANYVPLTPLTFIKRAKEIYPDYEAIIYEDRKYSWAEVYKRTVKFASALSKIGIRKGDTVSFLAFNTPEIFEGHYSVPMTGAVLNTINIRLDAKTIAYILDHSEAKVLVVDRQLHIEVKKALKNLDKEINDEFSEKVFNTFLENLDPFKRYFYSSDIKDFSAYKYSIDDAFKNPNLEFFDLVFERYSKRMSESEEIFKEILSQPFDFSKDEIFNLDTDKITYVENKIQLSERWRKILKIYLIENFHDEIEDDNDLSLIHI